MSVISQQTTAITGQTLTAAIWNTEFSNIINDYNGGITNANISSSAAISVSKINTGVTGSLVGTSDTQTLTNKTLTSPTITSPVINVSSDATGDIHYRDSNGNFARLGIGSTGQSLIVSSGLPAWTSKPSFSVYSTAGQSVSASTPTKIQFNNELFDTNNNFDSSSNYRFTPTIAGSYLLSCAIRFGGSGVGSGKQIVASIYKNGSELHSTTTAEPSGSFGVSCAVTAVVTMNGSTDYVEFYVNQGGTGSFNLNTSGANVFASGAKVD